MVTVEKKTGIEELRQACECTMRDGKTSRMTLKRAYKNMHSVIRTQVFWVKMIGVPTFVSVHMVRHSQGVTHFVTSNRIDRGGSGEENRNTPVNHGMFINAEALINMARKRLCGAASVETQEWMHKIKDAVKTVDPDLADAMVRECEFRNGICPEDRPCKMLYRNIC